MDEAILNSLLRYSKQLTPVRETYPIPGKTFTGALRAPEPVINLSTYYLMDNPSAPNTPFKPLIRPTSSASTSALSPQKRFNKSASPKKLAESSTENSRRVTEAEAEIKKIVEKEKIERAKFEKQKKTFETIEKKLMDKKNLIDEGKVRLKDGPAKKKIIEAKAKEEEEEIKVAREKEKETEKPEKNVENSREVEIKNEFEEYKQNQAEVVKNMQVEIENLKRLLSQSVEAIKVLQPLPK